MPYERILWAVSLVLMLTLVGGLVRILLGPTREDRMLAAQLFGTTGVAILVLLAEALARPELRDVALVFALLAVTSTIAFVRFAARSRPADGEARR